MDVYGGRRSHRQRNRRDVVLWPAGRAVGQKLCEKSGDRGGRDLHRRFRLPLLREPDGGGHCGQRDGDRQQRLLCLWPDPGAPAGHGAGGRRLRLRQLRRPDQCHGGWGRERRHPVRRRRVQRLPEPDAGVYPGGGDGVQRQPYVPGLRRPDRCGPAEVAADAGRVHVQRLRRSAGHLSGRGREAEIRPLYARRICGPAGRYHLPLWQRPARRHGAEDADRRAHHIRRAGQRQRGGL